MVDSRVFRLWQGLHFELKLDSSLLVASSSLWSTSVAILMTGGTFAAQSSQNGWRDNHDSRSLRHAVLFVCSVLGPRITGSTRRGLGRIGFNTSLLFGIEHRHPHRVLVAVVLVV